MSEPPSRRTDTAEEPVVVRSEERLRAGTVNVVVGRARLITSVVVEEQTFTVPVRRQEIRLVHEPVPESEQVVTDMAPSEETFEVVAYAEQVVVTTQVVPVERVRLIKRVVTEQTVVTGQVRAEHVDVEITAPPTSPAPESASSTWSRVIDGT